jgi:TonB family protein
MKTPMLLLFVLLAFAMAAQSPEIKNVIEDIDVIVCPVYKMPMYPGGEDSLKAYLKRTAKYPKKAEDASTYGTVYVTFIVNEDGSISDVRLLKGIVGRAGGHECNEEAMRVVREMPNWIPGEQEGKSVKVQYNLPIRFGLR